MVKMNIRTMRKIIKDRFPDLKFKLRTVSFSDLARDEAVYLESSLWGMTKGNQDTYHAVKDYIKYKELPIIVSF